MNYYARDLLRWCLWVGATKTNRPNNCISVNELSGAGDDRVKGKRKLKTWHVHVCIQTKRKNYKKSIHKSDDIHRWMFTCTLPKIEIYTQIRIRSSEIDNGEWSFAIYLHCIACAYLNVESAFSAFIVSKSNVESERCATILGISFNQY